MVYENTLKKCEVFLFTLCTVEITKSFNTYWQYYLKLLVYYYYGRAQFRAQRLSSAAKIVQ
jgi:hypothetical protein